VTGALAQHGAYERLLADLGAEVLRLSPEPDMSDAVFVEDTAIVLDEVAVTMRPGTPARRREIESVARALAPHRPIERLRAPGTMDGGDVLRIERTLYVGRSERTNGEGITQLRGIVEKYGYRVTAVPVTGCLHLKSACSYVGSGAVLINRSWVPSELFSDFEPIEVARAEPRAANTFFVGETLVMASNFSETRARLEQSGRHVRTAELSEFQKAEAGGSCMSIVFAA
jgi:dimethylargininase